MVEYLYAGIVTALKEENTCGQRGHNTENASTFLIFVSTFSSVFNLGLCSCCIRQRKGSFRVLALGLHNSADQVEVPF